ncbi:hypothetical protein DPMN_092883 [Dreissena polymorpha]|uniref:Uncharacterized protein n=1 Tax=Dreissena polymorpha TaxID=45954 RepID=A0A9D4R1E4_DREPO|nr:hypothetical protein DPMN_092883 [Dreissena polymorpha]
MYCRKYLRIDKGSIDNLAFRWVGNVYNDLLVEVDIVPRFVFPGWVPQKIDLKSTLYKNAINSQEPLPPFAVVVKTPDGRYVKDWQHYFRIDVARLESILIRGAPESARKGFILLKALRDSLYLPQIYDEKMDDWVRSFLTTYMLKTCLLHELNEDEEIDEIQESRETRTDEKLAHRREAISWAFKIMKRLHLSVRKSELVSFFVSIFLSTKVFK